MSTSHTEQEPASPHSFEQPNLSALLPGLAPEIHSQVSTTIVAELLRYGAKRQLLALEHRAGPDKADFLLRLELLLARHPRMVHHNHHPHQQSEGAESNAFQGPAE